MSDHVAALLGRVEQLTTSELADAFEAGKRAGREAAEAIVAGTMRRQDFVSACLTAAAAPPVHGEPVYGFGFFESVHRVLLRVPVRGRA